MSGRWLSRILALAPRWFRDRYGEDLLAAHQDRIAAAAERGPTTWLGTRELLGALALVLRLRLGIDDRGPSGTTTNGRGVSMIETTWQDVRLAVRSLRRNAGFTAAALSVIALGIGGTTAIFSALNAYFFRPLPFAEPARLLSVGESNPEFGWAHQSAAPANLLDWRERVDAFADVSGYLPTAQLTWFRDGEPALVGANAVLGNFFTTLGVAPALGRGFTFEETWTGKEPVVVISHDLWMNAFGGDPSVVGRTVQFTQQTPEIVGVMPEGFRFPSDDTQLWYPIGWAPEERTAVYFRRAHYVTAFARLAPGVSHEQAEERFQAVVRELQTEYPETNSVMGGSLMPLRDFLVGDVRTPLLVLLGAVSLLLLLACTNVANLMLVRASSRNREVAVRHALGAGRLRVVRQVLTESVVLALAGGVVGMGLGWLGVRWLSTSTKVGIDGATALALDHRVVAFTLIAAALSGVLFGAAPALGTMKGNLGDALRAGGRGNSAGAGGRRMVGALVSLEVALALLLAVGAGLMTRTFWLLRQVDPGFRTEGVLAVQLTVPTARYPDLGDVLAFHDRLAEALEGRPGIERVGTVAQLPLAGTRFTSQFQAEGWPPDRVGIEIGHRRADRGYFEALGIPLLRGRMFEPTDRPEGPPVVLVNEAFAEQHFPGEDPVGKRIAFDRVATPESVWHEIIGIVGDQHQESPSQPPRPEVFESGDQDAFRNEWVVVRGAGDALDLLPTVRATLRELDPLIPISRARTLRSVWSDSMAREEFVLTLLGIFGVVALLLAAVGVYGVTAQAARRRTQEIGIRMALGARSADVLGMMLRHGLAVVGVGLLAGLAVALLATRALGTLLYGVEPTDPATLAAVVALLAGVATAACYIPARRATAVDPVRSLRAD